jgi:hypothetical protein
VLPEVVIGEVVLGEIGCPEKGQEGLSVGRAVARSAFTLRLLPRQRGSGKASRRADLSQVQGDVAAQGSRHARGGAVEGRLCPIFGGQVA